MKKSNNKTVATTTIAIDPALRLETLEEKARQAAADASRPYYQKARTLERGGEKELAKVWFRRASFEYARALRLECADLGIEVPARG